MRAIGRFLLWTFAILGGLTLALVLAVVTFTLSVREDTPALPDTAVLELDLTRAPAESRRVQPVFDPNPPPTLRDMLRAIERAADDPRIKGISATVGGAWLGVADAQELAEAIRAFRESGKPAIAFAEDLGGLGDEMPDIAVASAFSQLWLQPSGGVGLTGMALEAPFFAEALDELDLQAEVGQRHEFKGGIDPLVRDGYSEPVRRSLTRVVEGWVDQLGTLIAENRGLDPTRMRGLIDQGPFLAAEALDIGLVDRLGYHDEVAAAIDKAVGDGAGYVAPARYLAAAEPTEVAAKTVALIHGIGPIEPDGEEPNPLFPDDGFGPARVADALDQALTDERIAGVLFRVESPGGAYGPSDAVRRAVRRLREAGKPVVAIMGDVAASGGYMVALDADRIVARPGTLTGSIGVYSGKLATRDLWARLGVRWGEIKAGDNAGMWSFVDRFDGAERRRFDAMLDQVYADFAGHVARGRGLDDAALDRAARGRVWLGADAKAVGLVDRLGGYAAGEAEMRALLDLPEDAPLDIRVMPEPRTLWETLVAWFDNGGSPGEFIDALAGHALGRRIERLTGDLTALRAAGAGMAAMPPIRRAR